MISVQNLRQLLNGNKLKYCILCSCLLVFASCSTSKSVKNTRTEKKPDLHKKNDQTKKTKSMMDTVAWEVINPEKEPPIKGEDVFGPGVVKKEQYHVCLLMPFSDPKKETEYGVIKPGSKQHRFINYYGGALMALEDLESEGVNLHVDVFDSEASEKTVENLLDEREIRNTDLIIGPHNRNALRKTAEFAKKNQIPILAPWQASEKMTKDNPYYIQATPNLKDHYHYIMEHALSDFSPDQIILLAEEDNKRDKSRLKILQEYVSRTDDDLEPIKEFYVSKDSLLLADTVFHHEFLMDETTVFIIPNWSFNDEDFIYHCLRKLNVEKSDRDVVVYGMPILMDSDKMSFDYYRNLNLRICRSKFVDKNSFPVKEFKKKYYAKYRDIPTDAAYEAYDLISFAGRALKKYGVYFQYYIGKEEMELLQTSYNISRHSADGAKSLDSSDPNQFDYFVNKSLDIVVFENDRFKLSRS